MRAFLIVVAAIVVFMFASVVCFYSPKTARVTTPAPALGASGTYTACTMATQFVKDRLKAPSTARFQACSDAQIEYDGDHTFSVVSYVDSENSFGAMLRTTYLVRVRSLPDSQWKLLYINTQP
jgi:hypothetical protein